MSTKQILATAVLFAISVTSTSAAYSEIECSSDAVFSAEGCDQCFDGLQKSVGDNTGLIDDEWTNESTTRQIMFEHEQEDPVMKTMGGSKWIQLPSSEGFWETPAELEALYSEDDQGYVLEPGSTVKFINSALGSAYELESTDLAQGENAGLLIFPLLARSVSEEGDVSTDDDFHKECVLYKAGEGEVAKTTSGASSNPANPANPGSPEPNEMAQVETGAEAYLILLFALILGFVYIKTRKQA